LAINCLFSRRRHVAGGVVVAGLVVFPRCHSAEKPPDSAFIFLASPFFARRAAISPPSSWLLLNRNVMHLF